jgi:CRP-like cAMP-binding protein
MILASAVPAQYNVSGLVAAISRNTEDGTLARFLEPFRWTVLGRYVKPAKLHRGDLLIAQGDRDRKIFFLESGNLKVDMKTDAGLVHLAILGPGTVVGEGSFFSHASRNASVTVYSDSKVWELDSTHFTEISRDHPGIALALAMALGAVLSVRMSDLTKRVAVT